MCVCGGWGEGIKLLKQFFTCYRFIQILYFFLESVSVVCVFLGIWPFDLSCLIYLYEVVHCMLYNHFNVSKVGSGITSFIPDFW